VQGDDHVCPGETRLFSHGVTVMLEASASGPVAVGVSVPALVAPVGYLNLGSLPSVTLGTTGQPLSGIATVTITGVPNSASSIGVLLSLGTGPVSLYSKLVSSTITYDQSLGGSGIVVTRAVPKSDCLVSKEQAGGTFNASNIATLTGVTGLTSSLVITGVGPADLSALSCLARIDGSLSIHDTTLLSSLAGLEDLHLVDGNLDIYNNTNLGDADSLSGLQAITGRVYIVGNPALESVMGLT
jgi:hypothetical protein